MPNSPMIRFDTFTVYDNAKLTCRQLRHLLNYIPLRRLSFKTHALKLYNRYAHTQSVGKAPVVSAVSEQEIDRT